MKGLSWSVNKSRHCCYSSHKLFIHLSASILFFIGPSPWSVIQTFGELPNTSVTRIPILPSKTVSILKFVLEWSWVLIWSIVSSRTATKALQERFSFPKPCKISIDPKTSPCLTSLRPQIPWSRARFRQWERSSEPSWPQFERAPVQHIIV